MFAEFFTMMGGHAPKPTLTDQNKAMEVTISKEYLNSVHQWCKWYILKKPKKTLGPLYTKKNEFRSKLLKVVSHMLKVDKFEAACDMLLDKNTI